MALVFICMDRIVQSSYPLYNTFMEHNNEFIPLLIVLALAFLVPLLINRFKALPVVVGEILAGLLLAQLGILHPAESPTLTLFSNIGLAFLMFLAGMEVELSSLFSKPARRNSKFHFPLPLLALIVYLLTLGLGAGGSVLLLNWGMPGKIEILTLVLGATSLGVVLPVLKNHKLMQTRGGQAVFLTATVADFLTVILLTIYILLTQHGISFEILSFLLIILAFIGAARIGSRFIKLPGAQKIFDDLSHATVQIKVRGAIVILLIFVVLAESMGIELILGAFLAGMLIALFKSPEDEGLVHKLEAFGFGLFIPVFFIVTGANLNISALIKNPQSLVFLPALLLISILVKLIPALLLRSTMGWRATFAAGFLLNTHLSLEVAIAVIGQQVGLLEPATSAAIIVFAVLTVVVMPLLFYWIQPPAVSEIKQRLRLISGWENNLARSVAQQLSQHGDQVLIISGDAEHKETIASAGLEPVSLDQALSKPDIVETVLVLGTSDLDNLQVSHQAVQSGIGHVIALVNEATNLEKFKLLGVQVFSPALYRATFLTLMARNPNMFDLLVSTKDERDLLELVVHNSDLDGRLIRNLELPEDSLVLSVVRDGDMIIPHGNTRLEYDDQVSILIDKAHIQMVIHMFAERQLE